MDRSDIEKKWIIEIPKTANKIIVVGVYGDKEVYAYSVDVHDLDSYAEPDTEKVREEAYEDGYKTAKVQCNIQAEKDLREVGERHYQKGLSDAWEAARKIAVSVPLGGISQLAIKRMFGVEWQYVLMNCTPATVIEKIRQHEQKQEEEQIQVGDEVRNIKNGWIAVVCNIDGECMTLMDTYGALGDGYDVNRFTKTGRHFPEIAEVLRKMKEES